MEPSQQQLSFDLVPFPYLLRDVALYVLGILLCEGSHPLTGEQLLDIIDARFPPGLHGSELQRVFDLVLELTKRSPPRLTISNGPPTLR
jgi:hypothetical protein